MSRHRFFLVGELPIAGDGDAVMVPLSSADLHHAVAVLRVRAGEEIDVVAPSGHVWRVAVAQATAEALTACVASELVDATAGAKPKVTLVFGVSKGSKNDDIVEGAVEVGVSEMLPVMTARSIVKLDAEKRAERGERWRRVALAAAKQSKRASVPRVGDPVALVDALAMLASHDLVLVAWEEASAHGRGIREAVAAAGLLAPGARVAIVVGPEGGLAPEEEEAFERAGAMTFTLGSNILRAQTAAVVAAALVIHELGGLGNSS